MSQQEELIKALHAQIEETQRLYQQILDIEYGGKASEIQLSDCIVEEAVIVLDKAGVLTKEP